MAKVTITLEGMEPLQKAFREMPDRVKDYSAQAVTASSFAISQRMKATVQVDTGLLKSVIASVPAGRGTTASVRIGQEGFYWKFLEYGRKGAPAFPFIRAATEAEATPFEQRIRDIAAKVERDFTSSRFL